MSNAIKQHAELEYAHELKALAEVDTYPKPPNWALSPWAVLQYIMGGTLKNGVEIEPKYIGNSRVIEIAIATLATERALLLIGVPGTAKTWVAEHMTAAICGDSTMLVQGTAGTSEDALRYSWNYAMLLAKGPTPKALVASPIMRAMREGKIGRIEELTRIPADVQDALITLLSEKLIPIPELDSEEQAQRGFNIIATANDRDKGVNELSSALKRRFNTVVLPLPATIEEEVQIVKTRVASIGKSLELPEGTLAVEEIQRLVTIFRELREGKTTDGKTRLKSPSSTLSTAEAISVMTQGLSLSAHFGDGKIKANEMAGALIGAVIQDPSTDTPILQEYLETVVKERSEWKDLYRACKDIL